MCRLDASPILPTLNQADHFWGYPYISGYCRVTSGVLPNCYNLLAGQLGSWVKFAAHIRLTALREFIVAIIPMCPSEQMLGVTAQPVIARMAEQKIGNAAVSKEPRKTVNKPPSISKLCAPITTLTRGWPFNALVFARTTARVKIGQILYRSRPHTAKNSMAQLTGS